jgi:REP element-mobilizing transposase RayT
MAVETQTAFVFRTWGGRRDGGGRPKKKGAGVSHLRRPKLSMHHPVHVTLRCVTGLPSLRRRQLRKVIFRAFGAGSERFGFRLVHFSVQSNHLHLVCEAEDARALSRGMQGLSIRIAKRLNRAIGRAGRVFSDRYHAHVLKTPREVRNVLAYVLNDARKHGVVASRRWLDSYSSALILDGWNTGIIDYEPDAVRLLLRDDGSVITAEPHSWLLRTGWRRHGWVFTDEVPGRRR